MSNFAKKWRAPPRPLPGSDAHTTFIMKLHSALLCVVPSFLYWLDGGTRPKIERCKLDGSGRTLIFDLRDQYPSALALDVEGQTLYWNDGNDQSVWLGNTNGTGKRQLASSTVHSFPNMIGISVLGRVRDFSSSRRAFMISYYVIVVITRMLDIYVFLASSPV